MQTLTAIIRAKLRSEDAVLAALKDVGAYAREHEPDTLGFFVAQDPSDPCVFTTFERFADADAMERHNTGAGSKGFFAATDGLLDGDVTIVIAREVFSL